MINCGVAFRDSGMAAVFVQRNVHDLAWRVMEGAKTEDQQNAVVDELFQQGRALCKAGQSSESQLWSRAARYLRILNHHPFEAQHWVYDDLAWRMTFKELWDA